MLTVFSKLCYKNISKNIVITGARLSISHSCCRWRKIASGRLL